MTTALRRRAAAAVVAMFVVSGVAHARRLYEGSPAAGSPNGHYYADPGPNRKTTQVFRSLPSKKPEMIWEKPGWLDATFVSNDGEYLVSGEFCEDSLPPKYDPDLVIATFYHRSAVVGMVRVRDIILDPKRLKRGYRGRLSWGRCIDFLPGNRFVIDTWELRQYTYDATTGKLLETVPIRGIPNID
jgi:hypothetical protein